LPADLSTPLRTVQVRCPLSANPFHLFVLALAGWLNRRQAAAVEYLREKNRVLRSRLPEGRLRFTDAERKRLAARGAEIGRALIADVATLVSPDTILRWHRKLVAAKCTFKANTKSDRAGLMAKIGALAVRFAQDNPTWGYDRIQGALKNVGHVVAPNTVKKALKAAGLDPAPDRGKRTPWKTFLKAHAAAIAATDFFTTEVWTARGLVTHYTLFVIHHATRAAEIVATRTNPNALFIAQVAKLLTDPVDGFLRAKKFLVMDRDAIFSEDFRTALKAEGVRALRSPPSAPNCNAFVERFVGTVRRELTDRMIFVGTASLDRALREFVVHYNAERNHHSLDNDLIAPRAPVGSVLGRLERRERLGGLLSFYVRRAA
jgi:transposase InsO family protein